MITYNNTLLSWACCIFYSRLSIFIDYIDTLSITTIFTGPKGVIISGFYCICWILCFEQLWSRKGSSYLSVANDLMTCWESKRTKKLRLYAIWTILDLFVPGTYLTIDTVDKVTRGYIPKPANTGAGQLAMPHFLSRIACFFQNDLESHYELK